MSDAQPRRFLVVANRTESAPRLLDEIGQRAHADSTFLLMVPPERHPDAPDWSPEDAKELVERAAGTSSVVVVDGGPDAAATIGEIAHAGACDEILLCTPPEHHPHWHRHSLPDRIQQVGIPVTVIPPDPSGWSMSHGFPDEWVRVEAGPLT